MTTPHPVDIHVGKKLRETRLRNGLSQEVPSVGWVTVGRLLATLDAALAG